MSHHAEAVSPAAPRSRSIEARRAARQAKAQRERRIVSSLNAGVSIAEIAARENVTEKRMRALVNEILARRMPEPPAQFLAIQLSRLNEALLVAYAAMSGGNLQAVDRVVRIVRELDRYHGFAAAEQRSAPDALRLEGEPQRIASDPPPPVGPETAPQGLESAESAPGNGAVQEGRDPQPPCDAPALDAVSETGLTLESPPTSPEMAAEALETIESAPESGRVSPANGGIAVSSGPAVAARPDMAPEPIDIMRFTLGNVPAPEALSQLERELASGLYALPATNPDGTRRMQLRMTPSGVMAS